MSIAFPFISCYISPRFFPATDLKGGNNVTIINILKLMQKSQLLSRDPWATWQSLKIKLPK